MVPLPRLPRTHHFRERAAERALRQDVEAFVLTFAASRRTRAATLLTVVDRDLPPELRETEIARRARDWVFVVSPEGALITCYRQRRAWRNVRLAAERRRSRRNAHAR